MRARGRTQPLLVIGAMGGIVAHDERVVRVHAQRSPNRPRGSSAIAGCGDWPVMAPLTPKLLSARRPCHIDLYV
mgnify:CR=1 FL=1